ncbi:thymidylate synthase [Krasilnikovia cinnamomea]|uniref:Thymidylate synthase n=1 Tax=Krasilnikovia cinnamomea TaxID=349313 RepID=A0A4Q7ZLM9_9ACTN|nr:thymidylate synthase [Krasilnikovia cinnamomea]RZU51225.1 thymidylate synthase [Krasilnikovia cinnamomea]
MLTPAEFATFTEAYTAVLRHLLDHPEYKTAGRGKDALEVPNISFRLTNAIQRTPYLAARRANIAFNYAELLWYVAGRDDITMISYYAPRLAKLSTDGLTLTGTAYGPRLFRPDGPDGLSQFDRCVKALEQDRDSKRAAMIIMRPHEAIGPDNPDVACTLGLQFMLRGGRLHATGYMRGNDAVIGLLCDTFSFTMIQELAARRLGVPVGSYTHHVGSMHINVLDREKVAAILAEADAGPAPRFPAPQMPGLSSAELELLLQWEAVLRAGAGELTGDTVTALPLPHYWQQALLVFQAYQQVQAGHPVTTDIAAALTPAHRWLLAARWPDRITADYPPTTPS